MLLSEAGLCRVRTSSELLADIDAIATSLNIFTSAAIDFEGDVSQLLELGTSETALDTSIKATNTLALITPPLSSADSNDIYTAIRALVPSIQASLAAVVAKKAAFTTAGVLTIVIGNVELLKEDTATLSESIGAIASSDVKPKLVAVQIEIDSAFNATQAAL
ncbi:hypothetical protein EYC84_008607 [Monilinia fructicola]|uniref:Hydrophobic surface binding protein n=1 Tax=Monilinia fructicola TaxID=38448 RepID=A0A5M9JIP2_MONFR|nr:hypothetical protein EYC84_008607 [Monilinia fructicola]